VNPDEKSLYADMRAAIQGDRERAEKRAAQNKRADPIPTPPLEIPPEPQRFAGIRRLFGGRRDPSSGASS
jgi:hypothetical protein